MNRDKKSIIINGIPLLSQLTGVGQYTKSVGVRLASEENLDVHCYPSFLSLADPSALEDSSPKSKVIQQGIEALKKQIGKSVFLRRLARGTFFCAAKFSSKVYDIYFEPNFIPISPNKCKKRVITVHDFSFDRYSQWHPKPRVDYFKKYFWESAKNAEALITVSDYIRNEAISRYGFSSSQIHTIHNGLDHTIFNVWSTEQKKDFVTENSVPSKYILFTGSLEPRKNITNLVKAYSGLPEKIKEEYKLVLVGGKGWLNEEVKSLLQENAKHIVSLGYVDQDFLVGLYNCATCFVYIPWYEGFGLPPLEAMACGCPCVVSRVASIPEVCSDAALYVSPSDIEGITHRLYEMLTEPEVRKGYFAKGIERCSLFDWDISAQKHKELFLSL